MNFAADEAKVKEWIFCSEQTSLAANLRASHRLRSDVAWVSFAALKWSYMTDWANMTITSGRLILLHGHFLPVIFKYLNGEQSFQVFVPFNFKNHTVIGSTLFCQCIPVG